MDFDRYIADIYEEMEAELIASMKRNLALHQAEEALTGLRFPQWQAMKLKEMQRFRRENERIIGKKLRGLPKEVSDHMVDELRQGSKHELRKYRKALKEGYKSAKTMKDNFFRIDDKKVQGLITSLNNDLTDANHAVLRMINDQYRQTIAKAEMFVSNGVYTEEKAVQKAIEEFESKGLNCIEYRDGRRVNIADYTSMAVRTANQRAYMVGQGEFRKAIGETLVIISRHSTSCDLCKPFEGKVLIDDVYSGGTQEDGDYMLLSEAMAQGLYHPRCRHGLGTYYPELEDINGYETEDNKLNDYSGNVDIAYESGIIDTRTANNLTISGISHHTLERAVERGISVDDIIDSLTHPLKIGEIVVDELGRKSQRFFGNTATVNINPDTGNIVTVWKTGKSTKKKLLKELKNDV